MGNTSLYYHSALAKAKKNLDVYAEYGLPNDDWRVVTERNKIVRYTDTISSIDAGTFEPVKRRPSCANPNGHVSLSDIRKRITGVVSQDKRRAILQILEG